MPFRRHQLAIHDVADGFDLVLGIAPDGDLRERARHEPRGVVRQQQPAALFDVAAQRPHDGMVRGQAQVEVLEHHHVQLLEVRQCRASELVDLECAPLRHLLVHSLLHSRQGDLRLVGAAHDRGAGDLVGLLSGLSPEAEAPRRDLAVGAGEPLEVSGVVGLGVGRPLVEDPVAVGRLRDHHGVLARELGVRAAHAGVNAARVEVWDAPRGGHLHPLGQLAPIHLEARGVQHEAGAAVRACVGQDERGLLGRPFGVAGLGHQERAGGGVDDELEAGIDGVDLLAQLAAAGPPRLDLEVAECCEMAVLLEPRMPLRRLQRGDRYLAGLRELREDPVVVGQGVAVAHLRALGVVLEVEEAADDGWDLDGQARVAEDEAAHPVP